MNKNVTRANGVFIMGGVGSNRNSLGVIKVGDIDGVTLYHLDNANCDIRQYKALSQLS